MCKNRAAQCIGRNLVLMLSMISMGKLSLSFYYKGKMQFTSVISGILSLFSVIGMIAYSAIILVSVFNKEQSLMIENQIFKDQPEYNAVYSHTLDQFSPVYYILAAIPTNDISKCSTLKIKMVHLIILD